MCRRPFCVPLGERHTECACYYCAARDRLLSTLLTSNSFLLSSFLLMDSFDVVIIGSGPAGLMAGCRAAGQGRKTLVLEKNRRPGEKILLCRRGPLQFDPRRRRPRHRRGIWPGRPFPPLRPGGLGAAGTSRPLRGGRIAHQGRAGRQGLSRQDRAADVLDVLLRCLQQSGASWPWRNRWPKSSGRATHFNCSSRGGQLLPGGSSLPPAGSRIRSAARPATATALPPRWATRSSRRDPRLCRSPPMPSGSGRCRESPSPTRR